eukprot:GHVU01227126.1.p1 GENE.GHVU01227126.1~~GHVU01227126.1.p1  ORF type:complete len:265 (-),score=37.17 GHVU01227126.1:1029-1823(-)
MPSRDSSNKENASDATGGGVTSIPTLKAFIREAVESASNAQLSAIVAVLNEETEAAERKLKLTGSDAAFDSLVDEAMKVIKATTVNREKVRELVLGIDVSKASTNFDGQTSDIDANTLGAMFDVQFTVGGHKGFFSGSVANCEGSMSGQIETESMVLEDDFCEKIDWTEGSSTYVSLKREATSWLEGVGLTEEDISWDDTARAVHAVVAVLAKKSPYYDSEYDFAFDVTFKAIMDNLKRLNASTGTTSVPNPSTTPSTKRQRMT